MNGINRKLRILSVIVEKYVEIGEPIGSKAVCEDLELAFSPATIRNEMANLAGLGYLEQPHISSGRIPSDQGYRLYINRLMGENPLSSEEKNLIKGILCSAISDPESLIAKAAKMLADFTNLTTIVTTPQNQDARIQNIQFVKIGRRSAMIVIVSTTGMVKNRLFRCEYDITDKILVLFSTVLNEKFKGQPLKLITPEFLDILVGVDNEFSMLMLPVLDALMDVVKDACEVGIKIEGHKNLLTIPGINPENILSIFTFLENKNNLLNLLMSDETGIKFLVGEENYYPELKDASVITAKYNVGGKLGVIGVIGPTRMDYSAVAAKLHYTAATVGVLLGRILDGD